MNEATEHRRCLVLSGRFGAGHDVVASACVEAMRPYGIESRILDAIALLGERRGATGDAVFRLLFGVPAVYDGFHFSQLRGGTGLARVLDRLALSNMWPRFVAEAESFPPDLLVSVFATGAAAAARLKQEGSDACSVVFCTDTWVHRLWVHDQTDLFLVTSEIAAASVRAYRPRAPVAIVPAPARPAFYDAPSREDARRALGVPGDTRCVLLMSGAWGVGPLDRIASALARAGCTVLAVAGTNRRLEADLRQLASSAPGVVPFGFTDRVPELMAACDVVVTSSGDTCTEARVVGRRMILLDVVPGHGRENLMYQLVEGATTVCAPDADAIVDTVDVMLADDGSPEPEPVRSRDSWEVPFRSALASIGFRL